MKRTVRSLGVALAAMLTFTLIPTTAFAATETGLSPVPPGVSPGMEQMFRYSVDQQSATAAAKAIMSDAQVLDALDGELNLTDADMQTIVSEYGSGIVYRGGKLIIKGRYDKFAFRVNLKKHTVGRVTSVTKSTVTDPALERIIELAGDKKSKLVEAARVVQRELNDAPTQLGRVSITVDGSNVRMEFAKLRSTVVTYALVDLGTLQPLMAILEAKKVERTPVTEEQRLYNRDANEAKVIAEYVVRDAQALDALDGELNLTTEELNTVVSEAGPRVSYRKGLLIIKGTFDRYAFSVNFTRFKAGKPMSYTRIVTADPAVERIAALAQGSVDKLAGAARVVQSDLNHRGLRVGDIRVSVDGRTVQVSFDRDTTPVFTYRLKGTKKFTPVFQAASVSTS